MKGLPARKETMMSSCSSWRWKRGEEGEAEGAEVSDMVADCCWSKLGEKEG